MTDLEVAHEKCKRHRDLVEKSTECGCFYCGQRFPPASIREWCDGASTAVCPRCGIDSVIPDGAGLPLTDSFLVSMHERWFARGVDAAGRPVIINVRGWAASAIALNRELAAVTAERDKLRAELDEVLVLMRKGMESIERDREATGKQVEWADEARAFLARTEPASLAPDAPYEYGPGKCEVCGWTLTASAKDGCVPGNCSFRPGDPETQRRLAERRAELEARKARTGPKGTP